MRSDKKRFLFIFIFLFPILSGAQNSFQSPKEIFQYYKNRICRVSFYKNIASRSRIGTYLKVKQYRIGIIVKPTGLIMVSSDVYPLSLDIISSSGASFFSGEPTDFRVKLPDGKEYKARFVGKDDLAKVAFLQIVDSLPQPLPYVQFAASNNLDIGDPIYVLELLGSRYDFQPLFTPLIINAVITNPRKKFLVNNYIPALSAGGLVIDRKGQAIGVTLKSSALTGFHTPSEFEEFRQDYLEIAPSEWFQKLIQNPPVLKKSSHQGKAWLGIWMQALTPELREYWRVPAKGGVVVNRVYPKSPAEKAGLQIGDIIIAFNGKSLQINKDEDLESFQEMVRQLPPGAKVTLQLFRKGKILTRQLHLEAAPLAIDLSPKFQLEELGIEVRELTRDVLYNNNLPLNTPGVYVFRVDPASPAGLAGLEIGDIIQKVNRRPVKNLRDFQKQITKIVKTHPKKLEFFVLSGRVTRFVYVDIHGD